MVKVYSNPFGDITDLPQSTFKKAHGFLLIYDTIKPQSVSCLEKYLEDIIEYQEKQIPVVFLGLDLNEQLILSEAALATSYSNQLAVEELLEFYKIDGNSHFKLARNEKNAEVSITALAKASLAKADVNALWRDHINLQPAERALPSSMRNPEEKRKCYVGSVRC